MQKKDIGKKSLNYHKINDTRTKLLVETNKDINKHILETRSKINYKSIKEFKKIFEDFTINMKNEYFTFQNNDINFGKSSNKKFPNPNLFKNSLKSSNKREISENKKLKNPYKYYDEKSIFEHRNIDYDLNKDILSRFNNKKENRKFGISHKKIQYFNKFISKFKNDLMIGEIEQDYSKNKNIQLEDQKINTSEKLTNSFQDTNLDNSDRLGYEKNEEFYENKTNINFLQNENENTKEKNIWEKKNFNNENRNKEKYIENLIANIPNKNTNKFIRKNSIDNLLLYDNSKQTKKEIKLQNRKIGFNYLHILTMKLKKVSEGCINKEKDKYYIDEQLLIKNLNNEKLLENKLVKSINQCTKFQNSPNNIEYTSNKEFPQISLENEKSIKQNFRDESDNESIGKKKFTKNNSFVKSSKISNQNDGIDCQNLEHENLKWKIFKRNSMEEGTNYFENNLENETSSCISSCAISNDEFEKNESDALEREENINKESNNLKLYQKEKINNDDSESNEDRIHRIKKLKNSFKSKASFKCNKPRNSNEETFRKIKKEIKLLNCLKYGENNDNIAKNRKKILSGKIIKKIKDINCLTQKDKSVPKDKLKTENKRKFSGERLDEKLLGYKNNCSSESSFRIQLKKVDDRSDEETSHLSNFFSCSGSEN